MRRESKFLMIDFIKLLRSFKHAKNGIISVFKSEQNFRIHCILSIIVFILAVFFQISYLEFIAIIISVSALLVMEIINTAFEKIIDIIKPRVHQYAADIKDIVAGAVFISALLCFMVVLFVFIPHIIEIFVKYLLS